MKQARMRRTRRVPKTAVALLRHPSRTTRELFRMLEEATEHSPERRFHRAMRLLTGLDVDLTLARDGLTWLFPPSDDGIADGLFDQGSYSGSELRAIAEFIDRTRPGKSWFIDAGANIGTTTIPMARAGYRVLAIEPVPATARYLKANAMRNGVEDRVVLIEAAIACRDEVLIAISADAGHSEVVATADDPPAFAGISRHRETISVPGIGLDASLSRVGIDPESVAIVWSDTQGSEISLIRTGSALWQVGVPLFMEFWPSGLQKHGGVEPLVAEAARYFDAFIPSSVLVDGGWIPQPLSDLHRLATQVRFTDVLLLPRVRLAETSENS